MLLLKMTSYGCCYSIFEFSLRYFFGLGFCLELDFPQIRMQPTGEWNCRIEHGITSLKGCDGRWTLSMAAARWNIQGTCQHLVFHAVVGFDGSIHYFYFLFRFARCFSFLFVNVVLRTGYVRPRCNIYIIRSWPFSIREGWVVIFGFAGLCTRSLLVRVVYSSLIRPVKHLSIFLRARLLDIFFFACFVAWLLTCLSLPRDTRQRHAFTLNIQSAFRQPDDG